MNQSSNSSSITAKVLRAMGVFGGVQVMGILCSVVRTKLVALWIGPAGVGLFTLYNSTIDFLSTTSQLNLRQSSVRDLSRAADSESATRMAAVVRLLALILGLAGTLATALLAPLLSRLTFGDSTHTVSFIILSPMVLLSAIAAANWAVMQGSNRLKALAKSTMWATVTATVTAVPLLWFFRLAGVVPVLLTFSAANALFSYIYSRPLQHTPCSLRRAWADGRPILALGMYMTLSAGVTLLASYFFAAWLNRHSGESAVGLYQAGYTLINSYVGLLFTAISMEYYPRLAAVAHSRLRSQVMVSHEIKVAMCLLMPILAAFMGLRGLAVRILYSDAFEAVLPYIGLAAVGLVLRASSWCMAYTMLARGDGRTYVVTEALSAGVYVAANIIAWPRWGFIGLGAAYIVWYGLYWLICYAVFRHRYRMHLGRGISCLTVATLGVAITALALDILAGWWAPLLLAIPLAALAYSSLGFAR
ncbi:MAG: oligosaccharide flippase family protein [Muribaculaceae bacterium]|nr:oligosaccharide flippase family protein [Muribaculaceae bacterium]